MSPFWVLAIGLSFPAVGSAAPPTIDEALARLYDFDFAAAHRILDECIAANSRDPLPYAFRSSAYLFYELDRISISPAKFGRCLRSVPATSC